MDHLARFLASAQRVWLIKECRKAANGSLVAGNLRTISPGVFQACLAGADADVFRVWKTVELSLMYEPDALLNTPFWHQTALPRETERKRKRAPARVMQQPRADRSARTCGYSPELMSVSAAWIPRSKSTLSYCSSTGSQTHCSDPAQNTDSLPLAWRSVQSHLELNGWAARHPQCRRDG